MGENFELVSWCFINIDNQLEFWHDKIVIMPMLKSDRSELILTSEHYLNVYYVMHIGADNI